jgi:sterol desaturase/sphingolipid hydroxylase (fatty acid hydroxylase superfamily)
MTIAPRQLVLLLIIAVLGHVMALVWYLAGAFKWSIAARTIYDLPISKEQIRREFRNSLHAPMHAVLIAPLLYLGFFANTTLLSLVLSLVVATGWAEIWHYASHRAFHLESLHWIHREHHKSHLNSWLTAISFSFFEKLIFDAGFLGLLAALDMWVSLNFYGIAGWYIGYLIVNSFSHANFELKSAEYARLAGKVLTTTTYHALHHSRYTGNYGLGTRVLDQVFKTEWEDYEPLYRQITSEKRPLAKLSERVAPVRSVQGGSHVR